MLRWTGIPVSVGIAPTKLLAKAANRLAKKSPGSDGVLNLMAPSDQLAGLARLELTDLWGAADRLAAKIRVLGIATPLDLRDADPRFVRDRLGVVAERIVLEPRGVCDLSRSLPLVKVSFYEGPLAPRLRQGGLEAAVATYAARAAEKMRRQRLATANLVVFITTNQFKTSDRQ